MTLSERFGKMAQWSVDRRDIDYVKNMKITKESDSAGFKVLFLPQQNYISVCIPQPILVKLFFLTTKAIINFFVGTNRLMFQVVIDGPDDEEVYRAAAPEFSDRRVGAGYFPETMHDAPIGLTSWDDVRVRYK